MESFHGHPLYIICTLLQATLALFFVPLDMTAQAGGERRPTFLFAAGFHCISSYFGLLPFFSGRD